MQNVAILSETATDSVGTLATYRLDTERQEPVRRIQMKLRTSEGMHGESAPHTVALCHRAVMTFCFQCILAGCLASHPR